MFRASVHCAARIRMTVGLMCELQMEKALLSYFRRVHFLGTTGGSYFSLGVQLPIDLSDGWSTELKNIAERPMVTYEDSFLAKLLLCNSEIRHVGISKWQ